MIASSVYINIKHQFKLYIFVIKLTAKSQEKILGIYAVT